MSADAAIPPPAPGAPDHGGASALLAALEGAGGAIWCVAADGAVVWANARARALGPALPDLGGRSLADRAAEVATTRSPLTLHEPLVPGGRPVAVHVRPLEVAGGPGALVVAEPAPEPPQHADAVGQAQLALLPPTLPLLPDVRLSGSYHPASVVDAAGGDWYDVVPLGGGRLALVVGDAVGSGVPAAGAMGRLRGAMRASALRDPDPAEVLAELDAVAAQMDDVAGASVFYGVLDAGTGHVEYAVAGHPAPLVVHPDGRAESLPVTPRPPLGTVPGAPTVPSRWDLEEGATLVLYSDGALAALGDLSPDGSRRLAAVAGRVVLANDADAGGLAGRLVAALPAAGTGGRGERPDDVAVLVAYRCATPTEPLALDLPAVPPSLPRVRRALGRWMTDLGMGEEDQVGLMVAVGEACANSVEHAYRGSGDGQVHVRADVDVDGLMTVTVRDEGTWRPPDRDPGDRGRGLLIMRQLVDDVHIAGGEGTTVTLRSRLRRAADADGDGAPPLGASVVTVDRAGPQPVVRVSGGVDLSAAEHLRIRLLEASHGGTVPVWLDLAAATAFGSAAVRVVLGIARIARDEGWTLQVRVPEGTPARHVLEVSGIGDLVALA